MSNMSEEYGVAVLVGSLGKDSINRKVANALIELAPSSLKPAFVEIGGLPLYNQDLDASPPASWTQFRAQISAASAVLFVTPEHNRSVPAALKSAPASTPISLKNDRSSSAIQLCSSIWDGLFGDPRRKAGLGESGPTWHGRRSGTAP